MSKFFYVLGLPRSRTLWLSFLLTDSETKCYHERLSVHGRSFLVDEPFKYVGSVDTNPINEIEYNGPLAVIKRDPEDVKKSVVEWFGADEKLASDYIDMYSAALNKKDALIIDYKDLDNVDVVMGLIKHLKPESSTSPAHIEYMTNCIIKTKNKSLGSSLEDTISHIGHLPTEYVKAQRIFDVSVILSILSQPEIFDAISEDGASLPAIDVVNEHWIGLFYAGKIIGAAQFKQVFSHGWDCHIHILPGYRKDHSGQAGKALIEWSGENLKGSTMTCTVPATCENVGRFLESFGFEQCGLIAKAWLKNDELHDIKLYSLGVK